MWSLGVVKEFLRSWDLSFKTKQNKQLIVHNQRQLLSEELSPTS